jgi:hypothetical protein
VVVGVADAPEVEVLFEGFAGGVVGGSPKLGMGTKNLDGLGEDQRIISDTPSTGVWLVRIG